MLEQLFAPDLFRHAATHLDGPAARLLGIAANQSIPTGRPVNCDKLWPLPPASSKSHISS